MPHSDVRILCRTWGTEQASMPVKEGDWGRCRPRRWTRPIERAPATVRVVPRAHFGQGGVKGRAGWMDGLQGCCGESEMEARREGAEPDGCVVTCVDWLGHTIQLAGQLAGRRKSTLAEQTDDTCVDAEAGRMDRREERAWSRTAVWRVLDGQG